MNEGELVTASEETIDSSRREVFWHETWGRGSRRMSKANGQRGHSVLTQVNGIDLALDLDDRVLAAVDVDYLVELDIFDDDLRVALVVLL